MWTYYCFKHITKTILENSPGCSKLPLQSVEIETNKEKEKKKDLCSWALHDCHLCHHSVPSSLTLNARWRVLWDHHLLWPLPSAPSEHSITAAWHKVLCIDAAVSQMYTAPQFSKNNQGWEMLSLTSSPLYSTTFSGLSQNYSLKAIFLI